MKVQQIREMAQSIGITAGRMKKSELIRAIQKKEGNLLVLTRAGQRSAVGVIVSGWKSVSEN